MCKIVGFIDRVDGYHTSAGFAKSDMFINACLLTATVTGISPSALQTRRQAGKFLKSRGIVFQYVNSPKDGLSAM